VRAQTDPSPPPTLSAPSAPCVRPHGAQPFYRLRRGRLRGSEAALRPGGAFLVKIFNGAQLHPFLAEVSRPPALWTRLVQLVREEGRDVSS